MPDEGFGCEDVAILEESGVRVISGFEVEERGKLAYGRTPRRAKRPYVLEGVPHFRKASASNRALSLEPAESKYGSAISYAPSAILSAF